MRTLIALGLTLPLLAACTGRLPNPIEVEQRGDFALSCEALQAELEGNWHKAAFLTTRETDETVQNVGVTILAFTLTPWAYIGLDLSDANQKELAALEERRGRLVALLTSRGCHVQAEAPSPYRAYVRERQVYTDEEGRQITLPVNHFVYTRSGAERLAANP